MKKIFKRENRFFLVVGVMISLAAIFGFLTVYAEAQDLEKKGMYRKMLEMGMIIPEEIKPKDIVVEAEESERAEGSDLWWLAHLIRGEADSQNVTDMRGVAIVAMNRVASPSYPDTLEGVITDTKFGTQYACYWDQNSWFYKEPTEECWEIAQQVLDGERWGWPADVVYQAQFEQGSGIYKVVETRFGTHYYCFDD